MFNDKRGAALLISKISLGHDARGMTELPYYSDNSFITRETNLC